MRDAECYRRRHEHRQIRDSVGGANRQVVRHADIDVERTVRSVLLDRSYRTMTTAPRASGIESS